MARQTGRRRFLELSGTVLGGIAVGTTVTAAERTDRFIVETKGGRTPEDVEVVHEMSGVGFVVVEGSESELKRSKAVKGYAPDIEIQLDEPEVNDDAPAAEESSPEDEPLYPLQWDKQSQNIPEAHDVTQGEGTRVAIIDSGVFADHPDLDVNRDLSRNFTDDNEGAGVPAGDDHGTHVAGIAGALDNGRGVVGTAPETDLVDCRVFSYGPGASFADILAAIVYSANIEADAANLSLGAYPISRKGNGQFYGKVLNSTMTYANREGTLLTIAAGNDSADLQHDKNLISLPNEGAQACSVAATGPIGFQWNDEAFGDIDEPPESPAFYTNYGTNAVTVAAPGGDAYLPAIGVNENDDGEDDYNWFYDLVLNTTADVNFETEDIDDDDDKEPIDYLGAEPTYGWKAGTSMAAPQVAGAAALVKSENPEYNANQIESVLKRTAEVPEDYDKAYYGAGVIDPAEAVRD
ncbi:peptidase S8 and S53 subtilisin kexin sedolisin [Halobacteriales archaeon QS_3_64_16]|nr:MAG: peptidase S8 and S53 subtilisin kexin sedolisin [Halobacteriales archaeon QS_3_64_16]